MSAGIYHSLQVNIVTISLLAAVGQIRAATYYVDNSAGNDTNNGTSTASPWKLCPGMTGFAGTYSHAPGDIFVFRGGVVWSNSVFPLLVNLGGGSVGNNDVYTSYPNWFVGSSWNRPVFDLQDLPLSGGIYSCVYIADNNVTVSDIEIRNLFIPNSTNWNAFGVASIQGYQNTTNLLVQNCYIHDWLPGISTQNVNYSDSDFGGVFSQGLNLEVLQCTIGPGDPPKGMTGNSGCGVSGAATIIQSNTFIGCTDFINGGATNISYNVICNGTNSYDPQNHANAIYHGLASGTRAYIYANKIYNLDTEFQTMLLHPGGGGATNTAYYIYNNVVWNVNSPIDIDQSGITVANSATYAHLYNNTATCGVGAVNRGQTDYVTEIDCENNNWITSSPLNVFFTSIISTAYAPVVIRIDLDNLQMLNVVATADGYTAANMYAPTSLSGPTVGAGTNLTSLALFNTDINGNPRPATGAWDIGAYQMAGTGVAITGSPIIAVTPVSQAFGMIAVGMETNETFTVQNTGGGTLTGNASVVVPFGIVSGGSYSLAAGQSTNVTVSFSPSVTGTNSQVITFSGGGGASVVLSGTGMIPPPQNLQPHAPNP